MSDKKPALYPLQKVAPSFGFALKEPNSKLSEYCLNTKYSKLSLLSNDIPNVKSERYVFTPINDDSALQSLESALSTNATDGLVRKRSIDDNKSVNELNMPPSTPLTAATLLENLNPSPDMIHPPKRRLTNNTSPARANLLIHTPTNEVSDKMIEDSMMDQPSSATGPNTSDGLSAMSDEQHQQLPLPSPSASPVQTGIATLEVEPLENQIIRMPTNSLGLIDMMENLSSLLSPNNRNHLLFKLLQQTDRSTLSSVVQLINQNLKRDVISDLPLEVSNTILRQLDYASLCNVSKVSKSWYELSERSHSLWKNMIFNDKFIKNQIELDKELRDSVHLSENWGGETVDQGDSNDYKLIYKKRRIIHERWMDPNFEPKRCSVPGHGQNVVTCLQYDDDKIITGADDKLINVYDTNSGRLIDCLRGHEGGVWALKYTGNTLVSGSTDRTVRIWNIKQGRCTHIFRGHTSTIRCLDIIHPVQIGVNDKGEPIIFPDEPLLVTGSRDNSLHIWKLPLADPDDTTITEPIDKPELENPYFLKALRGHTSSVRAIAAHGNIIVSGSYDMTVRVWDLTDNGACKFVLRGHLNKIYSTVLDIKRFRCISGSMDSTIKIWDLTNGQCLYNLDGHASLVGLLDLNDDSLVSAAADATLRIWDPQTGQPRFKLKGHIGAITCFQHDDYKVISGSERMLKLWDIKTGRFVRDLLSDVTGGIWQVKFDYRRCVAAVQRKVDGDRDETFIEILDFGLSDKEAQQLSKDRSSSREYSSRTSSVVQNDFMDYST